MPFKLTRKTSVAIKSETSQSVAVTPAAATDFILCSDVDVKQVTEQLERNYYRPLLDPIPNVPGKLSSELTLITELKGSGTAGQANVPLTTLLEASGFSSSIATTTQTFTLLSTPPTNMFGPAKAATINVFRDGLKHILQGSVGSVKFTLEQGQFGKLEFKLTGQHTAVVDVADPVPTYSAVIPPKIQSANLTVSGSAYASQKLEVDLANEVTLVGDTNSANSLNGVVITGRAPVGTWEGYAVTTTSLNAFAKLATGSAMPITIQVGSVSGNRCKITLPSASFTDIAYSDTNGLLGFSVPLRLAGSGNDSITLQFD